MFAEKLDKEISPKVKGATKNPKESGYMESEAMSRANEKQYKLSAIGLEIVLII